VEIGDQRRQAVRALRLTVADGRRRSVKPAHRVDQVIAALLAEHVFEQPLEE
jgi:hypothetical protein